MVVPPLPVGQGQLRIRPRRERVQAPELLLVDPVTAFYLAVLLSDGAVTWPGRNAHSLDHDPVREILNRSPGAPWACEALIIRSNRESRLL
jgi:hypothetical protein